MLLKSTPSKDFNNLALQQVRVFPVFDKTMCLRRTQFLSEKKGKIKLAAVKHGIRKDGRF